MSVEEQMQRCIEEAERQGLVFSKSTTGTYFLEERKEDRFFCRCLFSVFGLCRTLFVWYTLEKTEKMRGSRNNYKKLWKGKAYKPLTESPRMPQVARSGLGALLWSS